MEEQYFDLDKELAEVRQKRIAEEKTRQEEIDLAIENSYFFGRLKNAYKEARQEEKKFNFEKRHKQLQEQAIDYYGEEERFLRLKYGLVHVLGEIIFQGNKLELRKNDTAAKYIMRNRIVALALTGVMALGVTAAALNKSDSDASTETTIEQVEEDNSITLTRRYRVEFGDTLTGLSHETGININTIKRDNEMTDTWLYLGDTLYLNYKVEPEDLEYYTRSIAVDGLTIAELAGAYDTTINSLVTINEEGIGIKEDGTYEIISDTILVPNFITQQELRNVKQSKKMTKTL